MGGQPALIESGEERGAGEQREGEGFERRTRCGWSVWDRRSTAGHG